MCRIREDLWARGWEVGVWDLFDLHIGLTFRNFNAFCYFSVYLLKWLHIGSHIVPLVWCEGALCLVQVECSVCIKFLLWGPNHLTYLRMLIKNKDFFENTWWNLWCVRTLVQCNVRLLSVSHLVLIL